MEENNDLMGEVIFSPTLQLNKFIELQALAIANIRLQEEILAHISKTDIKEIQANTDEFLSQKRKEILKSLLDK